MSVVLAAAPSQGLPSAAASSCSSPLKYYNSSAATIGSDVNSLKPHSNFDSPRGDSIFTSISGTSSRSSSSASNASSGIAGEDLKSETPSPVRLVDSYHPHLHHHRQPHQQLQQHQQISVPTSGVKRKASDSSDSPSSNFSNHYSNQFENHFLGPSKRGRLDSENTSFGSSTSPQEQIMPSAFGVLEGSEVTSHRHRSRSNFLSKVGELKFDQLNFLLYNVTTCTSFFTNLASSFGRR